jgi:signal transduction histidine kinase
VARRVGVLAAVGVTLLIAAGIGAARYALTVSDGGPPLRTAVVGAVIAAVLMALVAGPVALVAQVRSRRAWAERERGRQRQAVAAHLHDSVLQTLALIQRSAGDEQRVRQLARQQERGLRDWLSGRDIDAGDSVAQSLAAIAAAVEDECPGDVSIEVISVTDARVGPAAEALLQAAREAVRNAAHHAGGVVRVVFDPDPSTGELVVFIRDAGPGFDPQQLPAERRGVRDAIIGRMEHAGGSASIETGPDGTEVVLRVPFSAEAGR